MPETIGRSLGVLRVLRWPLVKSRLLHVLSNVCIYRLNYVNLLLFSSKKVGGGEFFNAAPNESIPKPS